MKRRFAVYALAAAMLFSLAPAGASADYSYDVPAIEVIKAVNFRTGPSTGYKAMRFLQRGELLEIIGDPSASWLQVQDKSGTVGYVSNSAKYVKPVRMTVYPEPNAKIKASVNFRTGPSTSSDRIRFLRAGESIWILEQVNAYWYKAADSNNVIGYVSTSAKYVDTNFGEAEEPEQETPAGEPNGAIVKSVNFRTGPSASASRIRFLQPGEYIWILEQVNAYWYKAADSNNVIGYVSTSDQYVDTNFGEAEEPEEETHVDEPNGTIVKSVSFRTGPSTGASRIRYLQAGEPVWVLDKHNAYWYEVKDRNGAIGYVSTSSKYIRTDYTEEWKQLTREQIAERAIAAGFKYLGTPYEFGSSRSDTSTFDCSDFVRQAFLDGIGMRLPGDSRQQASFIREKNGNGIVTDWRQLQRGDLMFFMEYKGAKKSNYENVDRFNETVRHVGIYLGNGEVLHTYSVQSGGVRTNVIQGSQWENRFLYGGPVVR